MSQSRTSDVTTQDFAWRGQLMVRGIGLRAPICPLSNRGQPWSIVSHKSQLKARICTNLIDRKTIDQLTAATNVWSEIYVLKLYIIYCKMIILRLI